MALGRYQDAARTALIISKEEQSAGSYMGAHHLLYRWDIVQDIRDSLRFGIGGQAWEKGGNGEVHSRVELGNSSGKN